MFVDLHGRNSPVESADRASNPEFQVGADVAVNAPGANPAPTLFPATIRTGDAASKHAERIAASTPDIPSRYRSTDTDRPYKNLSDTLKESEVLATYNNIIILGDPGMSPQEKQTFVDSMLRELQANASYPKGRDILTRAQQDSYPLVIKPDRYPQYMTAETTTDSKIRFQGNFDTLSLQKNFAAETVTIGEAVYNQPFTLGIGHELAHRAHAVESRKEFMGSQSRDTANGLPYGAAATLLQRGNSDIMNERGEAEPNGINDEEDYTVLQEESPLAREMKIVPRPRYHDSTYSSIEQGRRAPLPEL